MGEAKKRKLVSEVALSTMRHTVTVICAVTADTLKNAVEDEEITQEQMNVLCMRLAHAIGDTMDHIVEEATKLAAPKVLLPT